MIFSEKMSFQEKFGKFFYSFRSVREKRSYVAYVLFCLYMSSSLFDYDIFQSISQVVLRLQMTVLVFGINLLSVISVTE